MAKVTKKKGINENGYSLLEMLIVLVILGIVVTLSFTNFDKQKNQLIRQDSARQLKAYLERARFDSIKRRASAPDEMAKVIINSPNSYILVRDLNQDGQLAANEVFPVTLSQNGSLRITGNFTIFPLTLSFNFRGQVKATDGNNSAIDPVLTICDAGCTLATAKADNSNVIAVSPTGSISFLPGGSSLPSAVQPNISTVSVGQKINQDGVVSN